MVVFTIFLEANSLRLVECSNKDGRLLILREERYFFSQEAVQRQVLIEEIKKGLQKIKISWSLSEASLSKTSLHCILSSDLVLLRIATLKKSSCFVTTKKLVQRDAEQFIPLPLEKISIAYRKIAHTKSANSKTVAYASIKTDFLEGIVHSIEDAGFSIQKISLLPLGFFVSSASKETLLVDVAERSISFLILSPDKILKQVHFFPVCNFNNSFCDKETGIPLLLAVRLQEELRTIIDIKNFSGQCWMTKTASSKTAAASLSLFLKKEFSLFPIEIDPCLLVDPAPSELFIERSNITPIKKFTAPSIKKFRRKRQFLFLIYLLSIMVAFFSPLSLLYDYLRDKKVTQETERCAILLNQRQLELKKLREEVYDLVNTESSKRKLKELQIDRERWPLIINELHQSVPEGIWITQLAPVVNKTARIKETSQITALEIKGLYLERINGEELARNYANKLEHSPLFVEPKKRDSVFSSSKEDGTTYAYAFSFQLQLSSPIEL